MRYAKLENGVLHYAPKKITDGEAVIYNPTAATLTALGYLPVVETDMPAPEPGYYYAASWEQREDSIVRVWTPEEELPPEPDPETVEERLDDIEAALVELAELIGGE